MKICYPNLNSGHYLKLNLLIAPFIFNQLPRIYFNFRKMVRVHSYSAFFSLYQTLSLILSQNFYMKYSPNERKYIFLSHIRLLNTLSLKLKVFFLDLAFQTVGHPEIHI